MAHAIDRLRKCIAGYLFLSYSTENAFSFCDLLPWCYQQSSLLLITWKNCIFPSIRFINGKDKCNFLICKIFLKNLLHKNHFATNLHYKLPPTIHIYLHFAYSVFYRIKWYQHCKHIYKHTYQHSVDNYKPKSLIALIIK